ncbi:meiosis-specific nuclear structural protein 1-like isoform X2 [Nilaparvata lugens]|nr:meiosis-specific nuclear structural protein 1-like isoform X2 [Nilaparvata lugens]
MVATIVPYHINMSICVTYEFTADTKFLQDDIRGFFMLIKMPNVQNTGGSSRMTQEELVEFKLRQQLRQSSVELRDLEAKLKVAYVNKELHAQIQERITAKAIEKEKERNIKEAMNTVMEKQKEEEHRRELEMIKRKLEYRRELQQQIEETNRVDEKAFRIFMKDKALIDAIAQQLHDEEIRQQELDLIKKMKTKEELDNFILMKEAWMRREKELIQEEDRKLIVYWRQKDVIEETRKKEQQEVTEELDKRKQVLMQYLVEEKEKKEHEQQIMEEFAMKVQRLREEDKIREDMEKAVRQKIELKRINDNQRKDRLEELERERQLDDLYRQQLLDKFAEDERIEQMTKERRRLKIIDNRRAVQNQMEERQRKRVEEERRLKELERLEEDHIRSRLKLIEEERLRMLREHATHLIGFLPKNLLQSNDFPHLGSSIVDSSR